MLLADRITRSSGTAGTVPHRPETGNINIIYHLARQFNHKQTEKTAKFYKNSVVLKVTHMQVFSGFKYIYIYSVLLLVNYSINKPSTFDLAAGQIPHLKSSFDKCNCE